MKARGAVMLIQDGRIALIERQRAGKRPLTGYVAGGSNQSHDKLGGQALSG